MSIRLLVLASLGLTMASTACGGRLADLAASSDGGATDTAKVDGGPGPPSIDVDMFPPSDPCYGVAEPRSCCLSRDRYGVLAGADTSCGPNGDESCCRFDEIPGGTFNRLNDAAYPATVSSFKLGRFLVTSARLKVWMAEGQGLQQNAPPVSPAPGAGAHPTLGAKTGWQAAWNPGGESCGGVGCLAKDEDELRTRLHKDDATVGWGCTLDHYPGHPRYPANCVSIYEATAFCAWDGGYLVTEAMWEYAVRGGAEQRDYAWGSSPPTTLDRSVHCLAGGGTWNGDFWCDNPANPNPMDVGHNSAGQGKWGTYDLQGNLMNMTADDQGELPVPCTDCISRPVKAPNRVVWRGISFVYPNTLEPTTTHGNIINSRAIAGRKDFWGAAVGFRCAYPNDWVSH